MRFEVERKPLIAALRRCGAAIKARAYAPALECAHIIADGDLILTGTDMDIEVSARCKASVSDPGRLCVNHQSLTRWLSAVGGDVVRFEASDNNLTATSGNASATWDALPTDQFPKMERPSDAVQASVTPEALTGLIDFAGKQETQYYLCGVHLCPGGAVATDSKSMARTEGACEVPVTIPSAMIATICDALKSGGQLLIAKDGVKWRAEGDGIIAVGKVIDGGFPSAWPQILQGFTVPAATIDADDVTAALSTVAATGSMRVLATFSGDGLALAGEDGGRASASVAAEVTRPLVAVFDASLMARCVRFHAGRIMAVTASDTGLRFDSEAGSSVLMVWRDERNRLPSAPGAAE